MAEVELEARRVLEAEGTIVVHCNRGYHRAALGYAVLRRRLCGDDILQSLHTLAKRRQIWPGWFQPDYQPVRASVLERVL